MIKVNLEKEYINSLFYDALHAGRSQFMKTGDHFIAQLSMEEYDEFVKDNNLIPYKNLLKLYESGEIVGSFDTNTH